MWYFNILVAYAVLQVTNATYYMRGNESGNELESNIPRNLVRNLETVFVKIEKCSESTRALQIDWSKINVVCHNYFNLYGKKWLSNSYFETKSRKHFNHCHASSNEQSHVVNPCFNLKYKENEWQSVDILKYAKGINIRPDVKSNRCFVRRGVKYNSSNVADWVRRQDSCDDKGPAGFIGIPNEAKKLRNPLSLLRTTSCNNGHLLPLMNLNKMQYICTLFTKHDGRPVTETYFGGIGNLKPFRHCYSLIKDGKSRCFPYNFNKLRYDFRPFKNEFNEDVQCWVDKINSKDSLFSIKVLDWYRKQKKCQEFDPSDFYDYDRASYEA